MIPGAALADWFADREAQRRSFRRVDAFAQKWGAHPLMTQLEREVSELDPRTADGLLAAARRFMDKSGDIETMMRELIATSRLDPFFRPPLLPLTSGGQNSLLLYHHTDLSISLGVTGVDMLVAKKIGRSGPTSVNFTGYLQVLRFVKAGGVTLSFWEAPPIDDNFVAAEAGSCRMVERRRIADGEEIVIDGGHQSFIIEHATGDIVVLQAVVRAGSAAVATEYDHDSRRFIGATSTDEVSSRLQMMVSLLRAMDREDAFPLFEEALASEQFYTRWHVMREMLAMDADAALPALRRLAADDPHPEVRAAAQQSIRLFFQDDKPASAAEGDVKCRA